MKTKILIALIAACMLSAPAQVLSLRSVTKDWCVVSIDDTNHQYSLELSTNSGKYWQSVTNLIGGPASRTLIVSPSCDLRLLRAVQVAETNPPDGFLIYATPIIMNVSSACGGPYVGLASYSTTNNGWKAEPGPLIATDPAGSKNTVIQVVSTGGFSGCGVSPMSIRNDASSYIFLVYFKTNVPAGPYPLKISGFKNPSN